MVFETFPNASNVHSIAHDEKNQELHVHYGCGPCKKTGKIKLPSTQKEADCPLCNGTGHGRPYVYEGVDAEAHENTRTADSIGKALHKAISGKKWRFGNGS